jgi:hypothetical protein
MKIKLGALRKIIREELESDIQRMAKGGVELKRPVTTPEEEQRTVPDCDDEDLKLGDDILHDDPDVVQPVRGG